MKGKDIALLAGLAIGGYALYQMFKPKANVSGQIPQNAKPSIDIPTTRQESASMESVFDEPEPNTEASIGLVYNPSVGFQPSGDAISSLLLTSPSTVPSKATVTTAPITGVVQQAATPPQVSPPVVSPVYTTPPVLPATYPYAGRNYPISYGNNASMLTSSEVFAAIDKWITMWNKGNPNTDFGAGTWVIFKQVGGTAYASLGA